MGRGKNEGIHILAECVCEAIPDPSLKLAGNESKRAPEPGGRSGKQLPAGDADAPPKAKPKSRRKKRPVDPRSGEQAAPGE
jgi:hypothetical protein